MAAVENAVFVVRESVFVAVLAGEHTCAAGSREGIGYETVDEFDTVGSNAVEVGCFDVAVVVATHHLGGVVVRHDINDVISSLGGSHGG